MLGYSPQFCMKNEFSWYVDYSLLMFSSLASTYAYDHRGIDAKRHMWLTQDTSSTDALLPLLAIISSSKIGVENEGRTTCPPMAVGRWMSIRLYYCCSARKAQKVCCLLTFFLCSDSVAGSATFNNDVFWINKNKVMNEGLKLEWCCFWPSWSCVVCHGDQLWRTLTNQHDLKWCCLL